MGAQVHSRSEFYRVGGTKAEDRNRGDTICKRMIKTMNHKIHAQQESRITREGPVGRKLRHFSGLEFVMRLKIVAARALRHGS